MLFRHSSWWHPLGAVHVGSVSGSTRMEVAAPRDHTCRRDGTSPGAGASDGTTPARIARSIRAAHRDTRAAQYILQSGGRTDRPSRGRRVFDIPPCEDGRSGRWWDSSHEAHLVNGKHRSRENQGGG